MVNRIRTYLGRIRDHLATDEKVAGSSVEQHTEESQHESG
mgnify:CR=1 FL=1